MFHVFSMLKADSQDMHKVSFAAESWRCGRGLRKQGHHTNGKRDTIQGPGRRVASGVEMLEKVLQLGKVEALRAIVGGLDSTPWLFLPFPRENSADLL